MGVEEEAVLVDRMEVGGTVLELRREPERRELFLLSSTFHSSCSLAFLSSTSAVNFSQSSVRERKKDCSKGPTGIVPEVAGRGFLLTGLPVLVSLEVLAVS